MLPYKNFRFTFMLLLMATILAASTGLLQSSVYAQCNRPGFKLSDAFINSSLAGRAATGDFNSDGYLDVAMISQMSSRVSILLGDGQGELGAPTWYIVGPTTSSIVVADMNNDAKPDLVIFGSSGFGYNVSVLLNNGTGTFGLAVFTSLGPVIFDSQVVDMNGDGKRDLVSSANVSGNIVLQLRLGDGLGQFTAPLNTSVPNLSDFIVGDFSGDGKSDVAVTIYVPPSNYVLRQYINDGSGELTIGGLTDLGTDRVGVRSALDFNGDNKLDIAGGSGMDNAISVLLNNGVGGFGRTDYPSPSGRFFVGDFDGNATTDLMSFTLGGATWPYVGFRTAIFSNSGTGVFTRTDYKGMPVHPDGIVADFNNDGRTDLLTPADAPATTQFGSQLWLNTCNFTLNTKRIDYDGDGITDFAVWRPSTGEWIIMQTFDGVLRTQQWGLGSLGDVPVPGDYDGDRLSDLAVFRAPTGDWYILRSSDGTAIGMHWGASGDKPVPGDYDGDGKTDIAVFRPDGGGWFVLRSSDSTLSAAYFGTTGDKPVQADYDNDDKTDFAVFRPSNGYWYILKSSDGSFNYTPFGTSSDRPLPGDYDGDGNADFAVFRPGEAWYFLLSSTNTFLGAVWHQDLPPAPGSFRGPGTMNIVGWEPSSGLFHVYTYPGNYGVGASGDIPVTTPYVIQ